VNIQEVERANLSAALTVQAIVADIEKRIPFRRSMRSALNRLMKAGAEGAKVVISGRLDGSEIARREKVAQGKIPLHTIRAAVDYARGAAFTTYGAVGVKVWVYGGAPLGRRGEEATAGESPRPHRRRSPAPRNAS
jgi:small subunit ribosomal protein S3